MAYPHSPHVLRIIEMPQSGVVNGIPASDALLLVAVVIIVAAAAVAVALGPLLCGILVNVVVGGIQ